MKLAVHKDQIIEGIQKAANIIPTKTGAASLRSLWLRGEDGYLSIMASNSETEFTGKYPAEIKEPGLVGVPGRSFADLMKKMPSSVLNISVDDKGGFILVECGRSRYRLPITTPDWFQELTPYPSDPGVAWSGDFVGDMLDRVSFCIDDDDTRDALSCLCLNPRENGRVDACGLNGHQFAQIAFVHDELCGRLPEDGLLIQRKFLQDIRKWLPPDEIELNLDEKRVYFRRGDGSETLSLRRANSEYPDYNVFVSKLEDPNVSRLQISRQEGLEAMGRIQVFNTENQMCMYMEMKGNELTLSAQGADVGSACESLEVDYAGTVKRIAFPTRNMLEIFSNFESPTLTLTFTSAEGPCGITGAQDNGYSVIIMPMKISEEDYYTEETE